MLHGLAAGLAAVAFAFGHRGQRETAVAQRLFHALAPGHAGRHVLRPGQVRDAPVAGCDEVVDRQLHRQPVVADHRRQAPALVGAVHQHGVHAGLLQVVDQRVVARGDGHHQPVDLLRQHALDHRPRERVVHHVGHEHEVAARRGAGLDALQDGREHRVGDVRHQHADGVGAAGAQGRGRAVGPVAQALRRLFDHAQHFFADQRALVRIERARHGRHMHAGGLRDIADGDRGGR